MLPAVAGLIAHQWDCSITFLGILIPMVILKLRSHIYYRRGIHLYKNPLIINNYVCDVYGLRRITKLQDLTGLRVMYVECETLRKVISCYSALYDECETLRKVISCYNSV